MCREMNATFGPYCIRSFTHILRQHSNIRKTTQLFPGYIHNQPFTVTIQEALCMGSRCARYVSFKSSIALRSGQRSIFWLYCCPGISQNYHCLHWMRMLSVYKLQRHFRLRSWKIFLQNTQLGIESISFFRTWKTNLRSLGGQVRVNDTVGTDHKS